MRSVLAVAVLALVGCSESASSDDVAPTIDAGRLVDAAPAADARTSDAAAPSGLVFNELRASGGEFVELYNGSSTAIDLGALRVADKDATTDTPKLADALAFPSGTSLAPGGYLVVATGIATPRVGPQTGCLTGTVPTCYEAVFGISNSKGDHLFILGAGDAVLLDQVYPMMGAPSGQSYGRFPNGTGSFMATKSTPGAENTLN